MASSPAYAATPLLDYCQVTTANTGRDGTGSTVLLASGTTAGKRVTRCTVQGLATSAAGAIRLFLSLDTGTTKRMMAEKQVPVITVSVGSVGPFSAVVPDIVGLVLTGAAAQLYASTNNTETFNIVLESAGL